MAGLFGKIVTEPVSCPSCGTSYSIEYNASLSESLYHIITNEGERKRGFSIIHTYKERGLKCPYCGHKFRYTYSGTPSGA